MTDWMERLQGDLAGARIALRNIGDWLTDLEAATDQRFYPETTGTAAKATREKVQSTLDFVANIAVDEFLAELMKIERSALHIQNYIERELGPVGRAIISGEDWREAMNGVESHG